MLYMNFNCPPKCGFHLFLKLIDAGNEHLPVPYRVVIFYLVYNTTHYREYVCNVVSFHMLQYLSLELKGCFL